MINIHDISIKNKLVLMQVLTCILVLCLCFVVFVITDIKGYKERKVTSTISIAQVTGSGSISAIQFLDTEAARRNLVYLQQVESDVINASIIDARGNVFASCTRPGQPAYLFKPPFRDNYHFEEGHLYVYRSIFSNKEKIGTVCLQVELSQLDEIKNQKFQIAAILLVSGIFLAFLIALVNQRQISAPILNLVKVINQIKVSNDYNRHVEVIGKDEINTLSSEFNDLMDEVARSNRKKDEFIGIASHELKTPLTSVKLYLETLARMPHDPTAKAFVEKAREGVSKLQNLIIDLLDVSRIQSGQLQLTLKELDFDQLVDECLDDAILNNPTHRFTRTGRAIRPMVMADRDRLEQVIINLLSNAVKYSEMGKTIYVNTSSTEGEIRASITDAGIGIAPSEHKRIFERFYRSKDSNAVISGFGLGLYICSQIIKRHKGTIGVESKEGEGSTFFFTLPAR